MCLKILLPVLAALCIAAVAWIEVIGLPRVARQAVLQAFEKRGVTCDSPKVQIGLVRGLVLHDVTLRHGDTATHQRLHAHRLRYRPGLGALLRGNLRPAGILLSGGKLTVVAPAATAENAATAEPLTVRHLELAAELADDRMVLNRLTGSLEGIRFELEGVLEGLDALANAWQTPRPNDRTAGGMQRSQTLMSSLHAFVSENLFLDDETSVRGRFTLDLGNPAAAQAHGTVQIADVLWNHVPVRRFKAQVTYAGRIVQVQRATLDFGGDSVLKGDIKANMQTRDISGNLRGALDPRLFYRLVGRPMPRLLAETTFSGPLMFRSTLETSRLDSPRDMAWHGAMTGHGMVYRGHFVDSLATNVRYRQGKLTFDDIRIQLDPAGREALEGTLSIDLDERSSALAATATVDPVRVLKTFQHANPGVSRMLRDLDFGSRTIEIGADLSGASLDPAEWSGHLMLTAGPAAFRDLRIASFECPLALDDGILATAPHAVVVLDGDSDEYLRLTGSVRPLDRRIQLSGKGAIDPSRIYRQLGFPEKWMVDSFVLHAAPVQVEFAFDEAAWRPSEWTGEAAFHAESLSYGTLDVDAVTGRLSITPGKLRFADIAVQTEAAETFEADAIEVDLGTREVFIEGRITGDPEIIAVFLSPDRARDAYSVVWEHFDWGAKPPAFTLNRFRVHRRGPGVWTLDLNGRVQAEDFVYRGFAMDAAEAEVSLQLPPSADIAVLSARSGDETVSGNLRFELDGDPTLSFTCSGIFNAVRQFSAVSPVVASALSELATGDRTETEVSGTIHLRGSPRPRLQGTLAGEHLRYQQLTFGTFTGDWELRDADLKWRLHDAELHGGKVAAKGAYSGFFDTGSLAVDADGIDLAALASQLGTQATDKNFGNLSGRAVVTLARRDQDAPWRMTGDGELRVRDGNLWEAPFLKALGDSVAMPTLGRITNLDADLEFTGNRLKFDNISTNGTILALSGSGHYRWTDHRVNFKIYGEALQQTGLIPRLTRPLSWFLEAEMTGTVQDYQWRLLGPLRRILPGDQG